MQIKFQTTPEDYHTFLKWYYFERDLGKRLFLLLIFSCVIGIIRIGEQPFKLPAFFIKSFIGGMVLFSIYALIPFFISKRKLKSTFRTTGSGLPKTITIQNDGIAVKSANEDLFWRWEVLKRADMTNGYIFIVLFTNKICLIPLDAFSSENESINFLAVLKNGILKVSGQSRERKVHHLYRWGLIGFLPNFGAIAGIILAIQGFNYKDRKLTLIGIACILFTVIFWIVIFPLILPK